MIVTIIAFDEARTLPMCLGHLPRGTHVRLVDGAFADFPHDEPYSTDGTLEIAERWGAEVIRVTEPWPDQMTKRTAALVPGEVNFSLDADELLHSPPPVLPDDADVGWVTISSPLYRTPFLAPRVLRVREGWHYAGRHHWLYDGQGQLLASGTYAGTGCRHAILPVIVANRRDLRDRTRDAAKFAYIQARAPGEERYPDEASVYAHTQAG